MSTGDPRRVEPTGNPRVDALIDAMICPTCRTIWNAEKANCSDLWHYDNKHCPARYERPGGAQPGDRIVACHLQSGHPGEHEEEGTEVTWWRAGSTPVSEEPARFGRPEPVTFVDHGTAAAYARGISEGRRQAAEGFDRTEEWALRYRLDGEQREAEYGGHIFDSRENAQRHIDTWRRCYPDLTYSDEEYLRRDVLTGPWEPAEQPEPVTDAQYAEQFQRIAESEALILADELAEDGAHFAAMEERHQHEARAARGE